MAENGAGGDAGIVFEAAPFTEFVSKLYSAWKADAATESWGSDADALVVVSGATQEDVISFPKGLAIHAAMFGLELSDVLMAFCEGKVLFLAATKKAKLLQDLSASLPEDFPQKLEVLTREKADADKANFAKIVEALKESKGGKKIGGIPKEKLAGKFAAAWGEAFKESGLEQADVTSGLADVLAVKSKDQLEATRAGGALAVQVFKKTVIEEILNIVDADNHKFAMVKLSDTIESSILKLAKEQKMDEQDIEAIIPPCVQSGGSYDLKYSAATTEKPLHLPAPGVPAVHIASLSVRHRFCTCTLSRTLIFNGRKEQKDNYVLLFDAFEEVLSKIKAGVRMRELWETATTKIKDAKPELLGNFTKELGWAMGYEIRERRYAIDEKNKHQLQAGMVMCLRLGFENLDLGSKAKDPRSQKYALLVADSLIVTETGYELITGVAKQYKKISWSVADEGEEEKPKSKKEGASKEQISKKLEQMDRDKTRPKSEAEKAEENKAWEDKNEQLTKQRIEEQRARRNGVAGKKEFSAASEVTGYVGPEDFPAKASGLNIHIDEDREAVLVPINGVPVPFHVSTIKNVSKTELGTNGHILRINFNTPGQGLSLSKEYMYLRELSYKGDQNLATIHRNINEMKKAYVSKEKERRARDEIVQQEPLRINPNRGPRLQNLRIYPNLQARGRKTEGDLEAHINGFRFTVKKASSPDLKHVDILYRNIKHAFFQPSNKSSQLILVHFRLKSPIMIGKQNARDIQFFIEHGEDGESLLENKRRNQNDRDELEDEERQRAHLAKLDAEFKRFCDKTQEVLPPLDPEVPSGDKIWDWDIPYNELEFQGNPKNSMVELYPTVNCIVSLAQKPVCIVELDEIDLAYYERLRPGNNNFDIAFIRKAFIDPNAVMSQCWDRISTVDVKFHETVREVLQKSKIPQYEGTLQINWNTVLKDYIKGFDDIVADGGWKVIFGKDDDEDEDEEDEEDDESFKGGGSGSGSDEDSSGEGSDDEDSDLSEYSEDESESEELSDEGMDSDEAEQWAQDEDTKKREEERLKGDRPSSKPGMGSKAGAAKKRPRDDSDDERPRKSSKSSSSKHAPPPKKNGLGSKKR
mmetsp:Transcript_57982/g.132737  ORF Transcript_57982/g.132737 Transcript_57982/m.132737 type:complete len:1096 (-) Transcript_57982:241-3528(-)